MSSVSLKDWRKSSYPRALVSIIASVGGLALFLLLASTLLVSQPIGSTVRGYFYGVTNPGKIDLEPSVSHNSDSESSPVIKPFVEREKANLTVSVDQGIEATSQDEISKFAGSGEGDSKETVIEKNLSPQSSNEHENSDLAEAESDNMKDTLPLSEVTLVASSNVTANVTSSSVTAESAMSVDSDCDLYNGKWVHDPTGPLYPNNGCPVLTQMQNCQGNGRPDKDYENWRWKPSQCDLPRFDANKFLELMRGKTIAFIGDSVARNQMESLMCILWQVEVPKNRGNRKMQRQYFRSTSTMIVRIWSSWLVHQTAEPFDYAPAGVAKLHLDLPDEALMEHIMDYDVIILSSGHWFAKQSVYILNNEIVGGQLWWPDNSKKQKINNVDAFGVSVETIVNAMATHPNYTGITIVRTFSPDHYQGGAWNTGGSCTGKTQPALESELVENGFTNIMYEKQVSAYYRALKKKTNKSKMKLMDITKAFSYRHDGHPGPYRSPDPNKITKVGPDGRPPPQDCLHWCMPGPVDTWNEILFEIIRREFNST